MTKKKSETTSKDTEYKLQCKCTPELKRDMDDLARLSRRDVSSILRDMATELVKANAARIKKFRQSAAVPIQMPTFASSTRKPAQDDPPDKGGDANEDT